MRCSRETGHLRLWKRVALGVALVVSCVGGACSRRAPEPDTVVVLHARDIQGLDPHTAGEIWQTQVVLSNLYEGLVAIDPDMSLVPGLASSWTNPDDLTWDFQLRPNVRFQTGGTLDAEDVVFSVLRARDHPGSVLRASLANVKQVSALAPGRVRIRTAEPDAFLGARLRDVFILSQDWVKANGEGALETRSAGTGPYRVTARVKGTSVDVERFDGYWRGAAKIPKGRFLARDYDESNESTLAAGTLTPTSRVVFLGVPGTETYKRALRHSVPHFAATLSVTYLGFDLQQATSPGVRLPPGVTGNPFLDPQVRRAVALAVGQKKLIASRLNEGAVPAQLVSTGIFGFDPQLKRSPFDPAEALRLLQASPYREGFEVDLDVRRPTDGVGESIVEDLRALGIIVHVRSHSDPEFFERVAHGKSSLYVLRFSCRTGDAQEFFDKWVHSRDLAQGMGEFNYSYDVDPVPGLDAEIDSARRELIPAIRREKLKQIMGRVMGAHLAVPLFTDRDYTFVSRDLVWQNRADNYRLLYEMRFAKKK
ncbi:MAG: ABC transporter substrate-binding protein [Thermoanaerobaculia bacterium]